MTVSQGHHGHDQRRGSREIDQLISEQLNEILHHPEFQKLEASWRGLHYLVHEHRDRHAASRCACCNVTKKELLKDLEQATEFDQSALFKKVYEEEYGTFGGHPFGLLVGDYEFGRHPQDMALLEKISNVAAAAHAPFIAGRQPAAVRHGRASPSSASPRDLAKIFESAGAASSGARSARSRTRATSPWRCRTSCCGCPTARRPCRSRLQLRGGRRRHATTASTCGATPPTRSAQRITNAFAQYGWCAAIRGVEGGGMVEGLPAHTFKTDEGDVALKCPTEIAITDRREKELDDLGFIAARATARAPTTPPSSARQTTPEAEDVRHRRGQRQRRASRRSCRTSWPPRASPTTSR